MKKLNFKYEIGHRIKDDKRDVIITNRDYIKKGKETEKCYKILCNICRFNSGKHYFNRDSKEEYWVMESDIIKNKTGCPCCASKIVVEGINDIPTTAPWMVKYFQGGYDEAKKYTRSSYVKIYPICPDCGKIKEKSIHISTLHKTRSIGCTCSDGLKIPEKTILSILEQCGIDYVFQRTFKNINKIYDFYLPSTKTIIESHGMQHYNKGFEFLGGRTLKEEQSNDMLKRELAIKTGEVENYIEINCSESNVEFIFSNLLDSELKNILNLESVDINKVKEFAYSSNLCKTASGYKSKNPNITTQEIGVIMNLNRYTIRRYLKQGTELGWCEYNAKDEMIKNGKRNSKSCCKVVEIFKDNISLGIFESVAELERQSEELFGVKLLQSNISEVCRKEKSIYKGYTFKYVL